MDYAVGFAVFGLIDAAGAEIDISVTSVVNPFLFGVAWHIGSECRVVKEGAE
jgi:hypothetical protein